MTSEMDKKVLLMILDGWGIAKNKEVSAVDAADTPFMDSMYRQYPNSKLEASGLAVGLPEGQMGNSEVGHMNIGAGRVVYQDLVRINKAIVENELDNNIVLNAAFDYALKNKKKVHFIGLLSDGGVHSHIDHLKGLISIAKRKGVKDLFVHAFMDGRDTGLMRGLFYLKNITGNIKAYIEQNTHVHVRYYAPDRV